MVDLFTELGSWSQAIFVYDRNQNHYQLVNKTEENLSPKSSLKDFGPKTKIKLPNPIKCQWTTVLKKNGWEFIP